MHLHSPDNIKCREKHGYWKGEEEGVLHVSNTNNLEQRLRRRIQARVATMSHNYAIEITGR